MASRSGAPTANPPSAASPSARRGPSTGAGAAPSPPSAAGIPTARTPVRTTAAGATPRPRVPRPPATASPAGGASARPGRPSANLPGTSLLAGIPCIVTVQCERAMRIKARVRYIGRIEGDEGQWVGVEALESAISAEAQGLDWNDGSKGGVSYFKLSSARPAGADTAASSAATSRAASPSLRPPSRRVRRSTSSEREASGPRKGLFVRPEQIMYVL
ncbi:uncharacterized protein JCM10292_006767 [Rhodotorula paludigena]|uniref:uncharacterized protein n=1 Tax=Rhodotorula paludigena TaxID=86838 RepID=UPI003175054C